MKKQPKLPRKVRNQYKYSNRNIVRINNIFEPVPVDTVCVVNGPAKIYMDESWTINLRPVKDKPLVLEAEPCGAIPAVTIKEPYNGTQEEISPI